MKLFSKYKIKYLFYLLVLDIVIECFIFNYNHWNSINNQEIRLNLEQVATINGIPISSKGNIIIEDANNFSLKLDLTELSPDVIDNIGIESLVLDGHEAWYDYVGDNKYDEFDVASYKATLYSYGEGNDYSYINQRYMGNFEGETEYFVLDSDYGNKYEIRFDLSSGTAVVVTDIVLNGVVPFSISFIRICLLLCVSMLLYMVLSKGFLRYEFISNMAMAKKMCILLIAINIIFSAIAIFANSALLTNGGFEPYVELSKSLSNGKVSVLRNAPDWLINASNPYDPMIRDGQSERVLYDYAFYDGKYYVYFGIVPCLMLYLPFYIFTGRALLNSIATFIYLSLWIIASIFLFFEVCKKYFKKVSLGQLSIIVELFLLSGGLTTILHSISSYVVPQVAALFFMTCGMLLYLKVSGNSDENGESQKCSYLLLGSLLWALVAGCRPQLVLSAVLSIPILWSTLIDSRVSRKAVIKRWVFFCTPYLIVAVLLMIYNYIRFDSVFEFGAKYNLTSVNVYNNPMSINKIVPGVFYYLFSTPVYNGIFPLISFEDFKNNVMAAFNVEECCGGLFYYNMTLWTLVIPICSDDKRMKMKFGTIKAILLMLGAGFVLLASLMGGLLCRYALDFGIFFVGASSLSLLSFCNGLRTAREKNVTFYILLLSLCCTIVLYGYNLLIHLRDGVGAMYPDQYANLINNLLFWL